MTAMTEQEAATLSAEREAANSPAPRTKVELPKLRASQTSPRTLPYLVEIDGKAFASAVWLRGEKPATTFARLEEIAHRCNVHPQLVTGIEEAFAEVGRLGGNTANSPHRATWERLRALLTKAEGPTEASKQKRVNCPNETTTGQCLHPHCDCAEASEAEAQS